MYWNFTDDNRYIDKKTFSNVHFTMSLPQATLFDERIDFAYKFKEEIEKINTLLIGVRVTDSFNQVVSTEHLVLINKIGSSKINASVFFNRKPALIKSHVDFLYLCSNGIKIKVSYYYERSNVAELIQVERCDMTDEEKKKYVDSLVLLSKIESGNSEDNNESNGGVEQNVSWEMSPSLDEYIVALRREVNFLRNHGGAKHKITNGVRLASGKEGFSYLFEMESELYMPDDTPFSLETSSGIRTAGTVLHCEEFQILIVVEKDLGEKVFFSFISVEPWKLLVAQEECIKTINSRQHRLAIKLINEGPLQATNQTIEMIDKGQEKVKQKVLENDITVIWGPPGTGKTHVMAEIAIDFMKRDKKVLVVSHSNVSVDGVVKQIVDMMNKSGESHILRQGKVLRYGYVRDPELSKNEYATAFNFALLHCQDTQRRLDLLIAEKAELKGNVRLNGAKLVALEKQIKELRSKIREEEKIIAKKASILATTISKVTVDSIFENVQYDLVMFDEVSMAYVTQIVCAATKAREKFICVGDFKQLPAIAQEESVKKVLCKDIFEYLRISNQQGDIFNHPWLVMLDEQRRMHPDISEFVNEKIYRRQLKNHESTYVSRKSIVAAQPLAGNAMNIIDLSSTYAAAWKNVDNSRFNILSAIVSFATAITSDNGQVESVGVICPYAAQVRLIRAMLKDYESKDKSNITCATVHQFQGSQSDVIVFDAVESYPTAKAGFLMSKDLNVVQRLINVAVTRAKGKFINISYSKFWLNTFVNVKKHTYFQLVNRLLEKNNVISHKNRNLHNYLMELNTGKNIKLFTSYEDSNDMLLKDIEKAEQRIVISIPDGQLLEQARLVYEMIKKAEERGVTILAKTNKFEELPEEWKHYTWGTDNAVFPLILIDDKILWYGVPASKGVFTVGALGFASVCQIVARIKGENTIEMIKSLSDLEWKQVGMHKVPLEPRYTKPGDEINGNPGLAKYVTEKMFCPKCKSHLVMVKMKVFSLKCSNPACDHREFLTKDFVNHYINIKDVVCPKDGGNIKAKLGKNGIYIACDNGHTFDLDKI